MPVTRLAIALALTLATAACGSEGPSLGSDDPSPSAQASAAVADCPPSHAQRSVPAQPAGFDGGRQLIPSGTPDSALVCEYSDGRFVRGAALTGDLSPVADELALPGKHGSHACTLIGRGGPLMTYLLRVTHGAATAWVQAESDPNSCTETGNGSFASDAYEADVLQAWLEAGRWTARQPLPGTSPSPCPYVGHGRPGDETTLLPGKPTKVRICTSTSYRDLSAEEVTELQTVLEGVKTHASSNGCQGQSQHPINLSATYAEGRPSILRYLPGCDPALDNGYIAGNPTPEQQRALERLLRTTSD
jgi:hypothetical protein